MNNSGYQLPIEVEKVRKRAILAGALGLIFVALALWLATCAISRHYIGISGRTLMAIAVDLSSKIDVDDHSSLRKPSDRKNEAYQKITQILEACQRDNPVVFSAYTMRVIGENASLIVSPPVDEGRVFGIEEDLLLRDAIGIPYMSAPDFAMRSAARGVAAVNMEFTHDHWGDWLTSCAPIRARSGRIDGIACVDEEKKAVSRSILKADLIALALASIFAVLFCVVLLVRVVQKTKRLIRQSQM
jgi:hypothetical protein